MPRRDGDVLMRKKRANPEAQIHRDVVRHLRERGVAGMLWWHTPNGGKRSMIEAANFKRLGVRAGVSDLILFHKGRGFALELKAKGGRATEAQMEFQSDFARAGGYGCIAEGADAAIRTLEAWGLLRGYAA